MRLRNFPRFLLPFALVCAGFCAQGADAPAADPVIARMGDTEVRAGEIRAVLRNLDANTQAAIARDPSQLSQLVRTVLAQRLVLREALSKKWDQDPAAAAQIARVRDEAIVQTYLQSVSRPPDTYPSDAEVQATYDAAKGRLVVPRQYRLAQIFVKSVKGADSMAAAKAQVKLDGIRKALRARDADFAAIARAESDEPESAGKGGEIGWLPENRVQPEIRAQLDALGKSGVSDPIRMDDGFHIIKVLEVKDPYTPSLAEVRPQLIQQMRAERARADSQQYVAKLLQQTPVEVDELALPQVLKP